MTLSRMLLLLLVALAPGAARADDQPQWCERHTRNMVSKETGLPASFDVRAGTNVKWAVDLGTQTYSSPIISGGKVFIGTNNARPRDPRHEGDRGVLMCFNESDGGFCWQLITPKIPHEALMDCPMVGVCSPPTVEGDRVYAVSNKGDVMCLDINGQADGNDGPFKDEGRLMTPPGDPPMNIGPLDADVIWHFDMHKQAGSYPHDSSHCSILLDGRFLYLNTCNGVDKTHRSIPAPEAPSLVVLDKQTGRMIAKDGERIGPRIFHCTWSSPALAAAGGRRLVFFGGGDGILYAFDALRELPPEGTVATLKKVWQYDGDPTAPKQNVHEYTRNRSVSPSNIKSMPVVHQGSIYLTLGGDIWWGKQQSWLKCIDAATAKERWSYTLREHCCSTPAVQDGLAYVADTTGTIHCVDTKTGEACWTHQAKGDVWGSTLVADGKVYAGTRRGEFVILAAGREKRILCTTRLDSPTSGTATPANGVLYLATMRRMFAIEKGK